MTFYAFGINHSSSAVAVAEAFRASPADQDRMYERFDLSSDAEVVLLSTCNRTEVYLYGRFRDCMHIQHVLAEAAGRDSWPSGDAFMVQDEAAIRHVLHVASGLQSVVLGDAQILSQMKEAYQRAIDHDSVHSLMHRLMHTAFRAAKRVVHETELASGSASISTAAVAMAESFCAQYGFSDLESQHVLVLGAGKMGALALHALTNYAPESVVLSNRTHESAQSLAAEHDATVVDWSGRYDALQEADVVIVATGAPDPVLASDDAPARPYKPLPALVVDVAVPRNVAPTLNDHPDYTVRDMDALEAWTAEVHAQRRSEVPDAEAICEELLSDFVTWVFHQQALQPAIQAIRHTFEGIRAKEVERHAHRIDSMDREEVERLTQSIMQKLLAVPIVRLKNVDPDSIDFVHGIKLLHALFTRADDHEADEILPERSAGGHPSLSDRPRHASRANGEDPTEPASATDEAAPRCPYEAAMSDAADEISALLRSPHS
ncbi:glutamyl-tRNA reductase [Longimonas halophila]|uniref:Glutamyl-tRNA reductase n=1 Tax=Longimonas halophila TaxID=1469170 RepID=A0A2H3NQD0_9BACT|nr:glutamyl-tRNA reductase [Longimonas halophila]PEN09481.1 glutamyl-tRNA reductase [Longimonas halophila]